MSLSLYKYVRWSSFALLILWAVHYFQLGFQDSVITFWTTVASIVVLNVVGWFCRYDVGKRQFLNLEMKELIVALVTVVLFAIHFAIALIEYSAATLPILYYLLVLVVYQAVFYWYGKQSELDKSHQSGKYVFWLTFCAGMATAVYLFLSQEAQLMPEVLTTPMFLWLVATLALGFVLFVFAEHPKSRKAGQES